MDDLLVRRLEDTDDDDLAHYADLILTSADPQWAIAASDDDLKLWAEAILREERDAED